MEGNNLRVLNIAYAISVSICFFTMSSGTTVDTASCGAIWADNLEDQMDDSSATVRLTVLHREHPCSPAASRPRDPSSPSALSRYHTRARRLAGHLSSCAADEGNSSSNAIIANGVPWDYFSYITRIWLGTPPSRYSVLVDTGSSLPWVTCSPCVKGCDGRVDALFDPDVSATYDIIPCHSSLCSQVPAGTCSSLKLQSCLYNHSYQDQSTIQGVASLDRLIYGNTVKVIMFGCTYSFIGLGGQYSGIMGLSANSLSLFSQLSIGRYKAMAFCFPRPGRAGFLKFGQYELKDGMRFAPMSVYGNHYHVNITSISVGNERLDLQKGQGENQTVRCFLDTGTPYTMLPSHVYDRLSDAVEKRMHGFYRIQSTTGQTCFDREVFWNEEDDYIPAARIEFSGGARVTVLPDDLWFNEDSGLLCLAFKRNVGDDVVLGSRHLMDVHTVVDLEKSIMGFWDHGCV